MIWFIVLAAVAAAVAERSVRVYKSTDCPGIKTLRRFRYIYRIFLLKNGKQETMLGSKSTENKGQKRNRLTIAFERRRKQKKGENKIK